MDKLMKILGFMTGTSLDGIDMAVIDNDGEGLLAFGAWAEMPMPAATRQLLEATVKAALQWPRGATEPAIFAEARKALVNYHLEASDTFLHAKGLKYSDFNAIGVHGQTVLHERPKAGVPGRTVQLFDGQAFAEATGVPVVCDFRQADIEAGRRRRRRWRPSIIAPWRSRQGWTYRSSSSIWAASPISP